MRRILLPALVIALLVGSFAGVASARFADGGRGVDAPPAAPFRAPAVLPTADAAQPDAYGFRSSTAIGAAIQRAAGAPASPSMSGGASTSVTVTAVVLPVVFIVVDAEGDVVELATNTDERDARGVLYLVREGSTSGDAADLDASTWAQARAALAEADAGTGTIWRA